MVSYNPDFFQTNPQKYSNPQSAIDQGFPLKTETPVTVSPVPHPEVADFLVPKTFLELWFCHNFMPTGHAASRLHLVTEINNCNILHGRLHKLLFPVTPASSRIRRANCRWSQREDGGGPERSEQRRTDSEGKTPLNVDARLIHASFHVILMQFTGVWMHTCLITWATHWVSGYTVWFLTGDWIHHELWGSDLKPPCSYQTDPGC